MNLVNVGLENLGAKIKAYSSCLDSLALFHEMCYIGPTFVKWKQDGEGRMEKGFWMEQGFWKSCHGIVL